MISVALLLFPGLGLALLGCKTVAELQPNPRIPRSIGLRRTLPSSACRAVLQFSWLLCLLVGKLVTSFSIAPISILIVSFGWSVTLWPEHLSLGSPSVYP